MDGVSSRQFADIIDSELAHIEKKVKAGTYKFTRYREKLIPKGSTSLPRIISIPTIRDALVLRVTCQYLHDNYPGSASSPPHEYVKAISTYAKTPTTGDAFVRIDVKNFYPSIPHSIIREKITRGRCSDGLLDVISSAIETPTGSAKPNLLGIPQGLSISNALSNIIFTGEEAIFEGATSWHRYVDDILLTCERSDAEALLSKVMEKLHTQLSLVCHELRPDGASKTSISLVSDGVDYLGFHISSHGISVRESSYRKMFQTISRVFYRHKDGGRLERLLWKLNLKITGCVFEGRSIGWVFFFRQTEDMKQLHRLDNFVRQMMRDAGLAAYSNRLKSFIKAFREIRYNRKESHYIPNFDQFSLADRVRAISILSGKDQSVVAGWTREEIDRNFFSMIRREAVQLERETVDFVTSG